MALASIIKPQRKGKITHPVELEAQLTRAIHEGLSKSDIEYLNNQSEMPWKRKNSERRKGKKSRARVVSSDSSDSNDSDCSESGNQLSDINAPPPPEQSNEEKKKKKKDPFDITKPTIEETDGLIGLEDEKIFVLAAIKGPVLFPAHQSRMRATSRLKGFMFYGTPVRKLLIGGKSI